MSEFWSAVLHLEPQLHGEKFRVLRGQHGDVALQVADHRVSYRHQMHLDVYTRAANRDVEIARVLALGARRLRDSDDPDDAYVVFIDPEGNEFCVCPI